MDYVPHENSREIERLLASFSDILKKIEHAERSFAENQKRFTEEVQSYPKRLGPLCESQATRAQAIRALYWSRRIPPKIIAEAFKVELHRLRKIAGTFTVEVLCMGKCGNRLKQTFKSLSDMDSGYARAICNDCDKKEKEKLIADQARNSERPEWLDKMWRDADLRRQQLQEMPWDDYIETSEWKYLRNRTLEAAEYRCQICGRQGCTLFVFPRNETPQSFDYYSPFAFLVLCKDCVPRCRGLMPEDKQAIITNEMLGIIMDSQMSYLRPPYPFS